MNQNIVNRDLRWLLNPIGINTFSKNYFGKRPIRIERFDPLYCMDIVSESDLEFLLTAASKLKNAVEELSEDDKPSQLKSAVHAIRSYRNGKSVRVNGVQRFSKNVALLAKNIEQNTSFPVNVNLYLSPGKGQKALRRHYDTHDVFVLQLAGNKRWRLYGPPYDCPLESLPLMKNETNHEMKSRRLANDVSARDQVTLEEEFYLKPGDCLYLPRGAWHEAEAEVNEVSCHLTIGLQPITRADLLMLCLSREALKTSSLRQSLPLGFASSPQMYSAIERDIRQILQETALEDHVPYAYRDLLDNISRSGESSFGNNLYTLPQLLDASSLAPDMTFYVKPGLVLRLDSSSTPMHLLVGNRKFQIASAFQDACVHIANTRSFVPSDLPGGLSWPELQVFLCQLYSEDLIAIDYVSEAKKNSSIAAGRWLPRHLNLEDQTVEWIDFGLEPIKEPFFQQTVKRIQNRSLGLGSRLSKIDSLDDLKEVIRPSGFIFHISRCGSTLISNVLNDNHTTRVISEPKVLNQAINLYSKVPENLGDTSSVDQVVRNLVKAFGQYRSTNEKYLVIKFSSWNLLYIEHIRALWPDVPCVIVIRDPLEVAVSCLKQASGWLSWYDSDKSKIQRIMGYKREEVLSLQKNQYLAQTLGRFLKKVSLAKRDGCRVIDYEEITIDQLKNLATWFGLSMDSARESLMASKINVYSKDSAWMEIFVNDSQAKRNTATPELVREIDLWTSDLYSGLRNGQEQILALR